MSVNEIKYQLVSARRKGLLPYFKQAARRWNIPLQILLAVASRETQIGTNSYYLANGFTGKDGHGKGIMQIDDRYHNFARITAPNDHQKMINYGARFLSDLQQQFGNIKDALSAYNAGPDDVQLAKRKGIDPDVFTTGGDYGRDVLRRAAIIKKELGITEATALWPAVMVLLAGGSFLYYQIQINK